MIRENKQVFPNHILFLVFFTYFCGINIKIDTTKKDSDEENFMYIINDYGFGDDFDMIQLWIIKMLQL